MVSTGTALCAKAGPMTPDTTTGSTVTQHQVPCTPTAGATLTVSGTASGQTVRCAAAGFGIQDTTLGFIVIPKMDICTKMIGTS